MEYNKKINTKQRIFLHLLADVYNWNLHKDSNGKYKSANQYGFTELSKLLIEFEKYLQTSYNQSDVLYILLHWSHSGEIPFSPYIIIYLNDIRDHFDEIKTVLSHIEKDKLIKNINEVDCDLNYGMYNDITNPYGTKINSELIQDIVKFIEETMYK